MGPSLIFYLLKCCQNALDIFARSCDKFQTVFKCLHYCNKMEGYDKWEAMGFLMALDNVRKLDPRLNKELVEVCMTAEDKDDILKFFERRFKAGEIDKK